MATRPDSNLQNAMIVQRTVEAATTVTIGAVVKDGATADHFCQPTTDGVGAYGVVIALGKLAGAAGDKVSVALLSGGCVIPVKVGTGGAARGALAKVVSDGVTTAAETVTTPVAAEVVGFFTQSGVAGDFVGLVPARSWITE